MGAILKQTITGSKDDFLESILSFTEGVLRLKLSSVGKDASGQASQLAHQLARLAGQWTMDPPVLPPNAGAVDLYLLACLLQGCWGSKLRSLGLSSEHFTTKPTPGPWIDFLKRFIYLFCIHVYVCVCTYVCPWNPWTQEVEVEASGVWCRPGIQETVSSYWFLLRYCFYVCCFLVRHSWLVWNSL